MFSYSKPSVFDNLILFIDVFCGCLASSIYENLSVVTLSLKIDTIYGKNWVKWFRARLYCTAVWAQKFGATLNAMTFVAILKYFNDSILKCCD